MSKTRHHILSGELELPAQMGALYWLDPADTTSMLFNEADPNKIDWWIAKTGDRRAFSSPSNRPVYDAANKQLILGSGGIKSTLPEYFPTIEFSIEQHTMFVLAKGEGDYNHSFCEVQKNGVNTGVSIFRPPGASSSVIRINGGGTTQDLPGGDYLNMKIHISHYNSGQLDYYNNNTIVGSRTISGATQGGKSAHIGGLAHDSYFLVGQLKDFIFFDRYLTVEEIEKVNDYLRLKHSLTF
jgi:hypothetical protein